MAGEVIDISRALGPDTPVWPGDPPVAVEAVARVERGDVAAVSRVTLSTHAGTHVDPPAHFVAGGATVDILPLDVLVGPAVVVDLPGREPIDAVRLAAAGIGDDPGDGGCSRLLLRTGVADEDPTADGVLTEDGARWLVEHGVRLVGADTLSIEPPDATGSGETYPVHRLLL